MEFLQVNLGNLLTIVTFILGGLGFVYTIRSDVKITSIRLSAVEKELGELRRVVVDIARQEERLNSLDQRLIMQGGRVDQVTNRIDGIVHRERGRGEDSE